MRPAAPRRRRGRLARQRDHHPPASAAGERLDAEWGNVRREWRGHQLSLAPGESIVYEMRRQEWRGRVRT